MNYIRKSVETLHAYVPGEQPRDPRIVKLNTNENPYPPSPRVQEAMRRIAPEDLRRYPDPGCTALRQAIASLHQVQPDQVFVGNGSDEVLTLCTRAFVEHHGTIAYFDTSYSLYPVLADMQEARRCELPLGPDYRWQMPAELKASLCFLANPNAPTGARFPDADVGAFCERFQGVVVIDEAYADFADGNCLDLARRLPNVIVTRTLSKSYSLAGLRVGYAIGPVALLEALGKLKDSYNVSAFSQQVALAAIEDAASMRVSVDRIKATRNRVRAALLADGHQVWPSETNFLWMRPCGGSAKEVFDGLRRHGIVIRHFAGPRTADCLRVTVGTDGEMDRFLEALRATVDGKAAG